MISGSFAEHQRSLLAAHLHHLKWLEEEVAVVEQAVRRRIEAYKVLMERLDVIPGVGWLTAWTILGKR